MVSRRSHMAEVRIGKRCAETLFMDYHHQNNVRIKIVRIFNTYGPRMLPNDGRVVSNFIVQALQNKPITIYGNGLQTRSFQYVDDLVDGLIRMMNTDESVTGPVNIGNPKEFTIIDLARTIIEMTDSNSEITYHDLPQDDPVQRQPDITLAKKELQRWEPTIGIIDGLEKTIQYFEKNIFS